MALRTVTTVATELRSVSVIRFVFHSDRALEVHEQALSNIDRRPGDLDRTVGARLIATDLLVSSPNAREPIHRLQPDIRQTEVSCHR